MYEEWERDKNKVTQGISEPKAWELGIGPDTIDRTRWQGRSSIDFVKKNENMVSSAYMRYEIPFPGVFMCVNSFEWAVYPMLSAVNSPVVLCAA